MLHTYRRLSKLCINADAILGSVVSAASRDTQAASLSDLQRRARAFSNDGSSSEQDDVKADAATERRTSGATATTSEAASRMNAQQGSTTLEGAKEEARQRRIKSIAHLRPAAAKLVGIKPDDTVNSRSRGSTDGSRARTSLGGGSRNVLEEKKAYRQERAKRQREVQAKVAQAQAEASQTLAAKQEHRREAREAERAAEAAASRMPEILAHKTLKEELTQEEWTKYVTVDKDLLPEVFAPEERLESWHPKGGCPGLQEELEATGSSFVMHRECVQRLTEVISSKTQKQLYLTGPASSGKSIALAAVVSALRAKNWLVMYVPDAKQMTHGGFFHQNKEGSWDTLGCAKLMMHYLLVGNPDRVASERSSKSGQTLKELIEKALDSRNNDAVEVVDTFLEVKDAVAAASNTLIAVDNYQALYTPSDYGEWMNQHHRRVIQPEELRVARAMRLLEQPPLQDGVVVCAASRGGPFSPKVRMPMAKEALFNIPRMSREEWISMAFYYYMQHITDEIRPEEVHRAFFTLSGNAKEYRVWADAFTFEALAHVA